MCRKYIFLLLLLCVGFSSVQAQTRSADRTKATKIADAVMLLPAKNSPELNTIMGELETLDNVVVDLATSLTDPGAGDDTQFRDAISGLAMYSAKTPQREKIAKELGIAIEQAKSDEIRDFLFIQLQYVAGKESLTIAEKFIQSQRLSDAAVRVLIRIGTDASGQLLLKALPVAKENIQLNIVAALGDLKYFPALESITGLAATSDSDLRKVCLRALANIASTSSEKIMKDAVAKVEYSYENTDALASYFLYLKNLNKGENRDLVAKACKDFMKATSKTDKYPARIAAFNLYLQSAPEKAITEIGTVLKNSSNNMAEAELKAAALVASSKNSSPKVTELLVKQVKVEKNPVSKARLIRVLGERGDNLAESTILSGLKDPSTEVVVASVKAIADLLNENASKYVINTMNTSKIEVVEAGKGVLLSMKGDQAAEVAKAFAQINSDQARKVFLEIIASRGNPQQAEVVFTNLTNSNAEIREAAFNALPSIAEISNLSKLADQLSIAKSEAEQTAVQQAIYVALKQAGNQEKQADLLVKTMNSTSSSVKNLYYNIFAKIGGTKALEVTIAGFNSGNNDAKNAAFEALASWSDFGATTELIAICRNPQAETYFDKAFNSYVSQINPSNNPIEQKLLLLTSALEVAKTDKQKETVIRQMGEIGTFLSIVTIGNYLDDKNLQQTAARAAISAATKCKDSYGDIINAIVKKALSLNNHPEAEYQKAALIKNLTSLPKGKGYVSMFNGKDLSGWMGLVENPIARGKMTPKQLAAKQVKADEIMHQNWKVENGLIVYEGKGYDNLCSDKMYGDFEMLVDWKITAKGDAGIYLRGSPQVQIWDIALTEVGAQVGSGGLYNNQKNPSSPLTVADNPVNEWNNFYIRMIGDKVTVYLNGVLVTDNVVLENYWNRAIPIFNEDAIELQAHGERVEYRNVYVREIYRPMAYEVSDVEKKEGFTPLFNALDMTGWKGNLKDYVVREGMIVCDPSYGGSGNLYTDKEYSDFVLRFDFKLTPGANNGLGIRTPDQGDAAYHGMELQILDSEADIYKNLEIYQYHGSVYGVIPAKRGYLKPVGEWNTQEVVAKGNKIKVILNGTVILDGDIAKASDNFTKTMDGKNHPGLSNPKGYIGFLGHGSEVFFKNIRIKEL